MHLAIRFVDPGLWTIDFGNSSANGDALYFNAGIDHGADGLFGDIQGATSEPGALGWRCFEL